MMSMPNRAGAYLLDQLLAYSTQSKQARIIELSVDVVSS